MKKITILLGIIIQGITVYAQQLEMSSRFSVQGENPGLKFVQLTENIPWSDQSDLYPQTKWNCNCIDTLYIVRHTTGFFDIQDYDSAYYISGYTCDERHLIYDPDNPTMLTRLKVNYSGNILWQHIDSIMRGDHFTMYNTSLIKLSDSNYLQMGVVVNDYNSPKNWDIRIPVYIKFDANGDTLWRKMFVDTANLHCGDWPQDIVAEDDGGYTVAALIGSDSKTYSLDSLIDFWYVDSTYVGLIRYDSLGNIVKRKHHFIGGEKVPVSLGLLMKQPDGGYIVGGENRFNGPINPGKYYLLKVDSSFNIIWKKTFSQTVYDQSMIDIISYGNQFYHFAVNRADTPIVYDAYGTAWYNGYYQIGKMDSAFEIIEDTIFRMNLTDPPNPFYYDAGHLKGTVNGINNNGITALAMVGYGANLVHLDSNYNFQWNRWLSYFPYFAEDPYKMRRAHDGGYLIVGVSKRSGTGGWFVKTDTNGYALPNGADTLYHIGIREGHPGTTSASITIYPNPARSDTEIYVVISGVNSGGTIKLFDIQGNLIINTILPRGRHSIRIRIAGLSPGIYPLHYINPDMHICNKFLVI